MVQCVLALGKLNNTIDLCHKVERVEDKGYLRIKTRSKLVEKEKHAFALHVLYCVSVYIYQLITTTYYTHYTNLRSLVRE